MSNSVRCRSLSGQLVIDENGRFLRWNRNFSQVSGYSADELARMAATDFFVDQEKALIAGRIAEVFEKGKAEVEASFLLKDGGTIPYLFTAVYFEKDSKRGFVGVAVDFSQRKVIEKELRIERDFSRRHAR